MLHDERRKKKDGCRLSSFVLRHEEGNSEVLLSHGPHRPQASTRIYPWQILQAHIALIILFTQQPKDMLVVDLAAARLVAAWHIGHMDMADQFQVIGDIGAQISLTDLLMVNIIQQLDVRTVNFFNNLEALD